MIDLLRTRRSIRKFRPQAIEPDKLEILKEAVLRAPSSKNSMPCELIFVHDQAIIARLSQSKPTGAGPLLTSPLAVVVLANESKTGAWIEDCSIASIILQLTAHSLGLGSCWVQIRGREHSEEKMSEVYVREILEIPEDFRVLSIVAIGYPAHSPEGKPFDSLDFQKIHPDKF